MRLQDISTGEELILEVAWGDNVYELPTNAVGSNENGLLIKPMVYNEKVLDFSVANEKDMIFSLYGIDPISNTRMVWRNLQLMSMVYNQKIYYAVRTSVFNSNATNSERRVHSRMVLDVDGMLEVKELGRNINVHVVDLSDNGISFTTDLNIDLNKLPYVIRFEDVVKDDLFKLHMKCVWVRRNVIDGKILWGCKISEVDRNVLAYICLKRAYKKVSS